MPRKPRLESAGAIHHVTARGVVRREIVRDEQDSLAWVNLLGETCITHEWRCIAYCLMPNHYHVVVQTTRPNLGVGMRHLNSSFALRFNYRHDSAGHVFQGRFHSEHVDRDSYLLEVTRYVLLNPVRAKLCDDPLDWPWSSCRVMFGKAARPGWLEPDLALDILGPRTSGREEHLERFVRGGTAPR
jgi:REP element-mobilizing transposase RayT